MNISKGSGNGEFLRDGTERAVHQKDILRRRVELILADATVVNTILNTTSDADLHLKDLIHGCHLFEVLSTNANILVMGLLRQVKHVGCEERLAIYFEVLLVSFDHAIKPWEELLGTMVRVA